MTTFTEERAMVDAVLEKFSQHPTFLSVAFVERLQTEARKMGLIEKAKSKKEWLFGELINAEWETLPDEVKQEITREAYWQECSYWINDCMPFPLVSASGETLRRWCEVTKTFENMPALYAFRDVLSFDHFRQARALYNREKVPSPDKALADAYVNTWTADEMVRHFDPPQTPDEYTRATGWLASFQACKFEWLTKDKRERVVSLLREIEQIVTKQVRVEAE